MEAIVYAALMVPLLTSALITIGKTASVVGVINLLGSLVCSVLALTVVWQVYLTGPLQFQLFYIDQLSTVFLIVVAILTFTSALFSISYMKKEAIHEKYSLKELKWYYLLCNIFSFTMITVPIVENLGLMWVTVEATTLASALLVAFNFSRASIEAAWKYVMICTVGLCLALLGTILLYFAQINIGVASGVEPLSWLALMEVGSSLDPDTLKIAFVFIIIGYGAKAGLAPMHTWLPDAHSQAPSPVSGLLSGALLSCALYVIMRNIAIIKGTIVFPFVQQLLIGLGVFSVFIVIPFMMVQHDIKRLLAYSSVEHMGIITLALGIGTPLAVYGALLHILNHAVAKSGLFYLAGIITQEYRTKQIMRIRDMLRVMPRIGSLFLLYSFVITGAPPFGIFFSKLMITWAAFASGYYLIGTILLILLGAVFSGMIFYCFKMVYSSAQPSAAKPTSMGFTAITALVISTILITVSGWYLPPGLALSLRQAAMLVTGG